MVLLREQTTRSQPVVIDHSGGQIAFHALWPTFGAVVEGVDLSEPVTAEVSAILYDAFLLYHGLLFTDQQLTPAEELRAVTHFDQLPDSGAQYGKQFRLQEEPLIRVLSNKVDDAGDRVGIVMGKQGPEWHTDGTSMTRYPIASQLYCLESNPVGGDTLFANSHLAFETLPPATRSRLAPLMATYNSDHLQRKLAVYDSRPLELSGAADVEWPLVLEHSTSGRPAFFFAGGEMTQLAGLTEQERLDVVAEISDHLWASPALTYRHAWRPGDLLVWDNRSVLHSATFYDYAGHPRLLHHVIGAGLSPLHQAS
jgi:alpha-ketoglutarate-dependent taurine dioxygenase